MAQVTFRQGEFIFREGDESDCAYTILDGRVEILGGHHDRPVRIALLRPGEIFGEMGLVDERPRSLSARALDDVRLVTVTQDELLDLLTHQPEESLRFLRMLFERLRAMTQRVLLPDARPLAPPIGGRQLAVTLLSHTPHTARVLPSTGLRISRLPFRVGRESGKTEARPLEMNDLSLRDEVPYNVSRNHFCIDAERDRIVVRDRGSFLGTIVNGRGIGGGHDAGSADLDLGDNEITVGRPDSPFRFGVVVERLSDAGL